ncbi:MAG: hypothetical protein JSR67_03155 [Proteobacteria bacterium]|nr:hypothetical protein [Pseudomonadota bacterium]
MNSTGELDPNSAWALIASGRYGPEPATDRTAAGQAGSTTLTVLNSLAEVRLAVNQVAASAQRFISIYTPDLEPDLYDQTAFLEIIKNFVLTRSFAKVRVLLGQSPGVMRDSNRFFAMGRRLSSCIDIRHAGNPTSAIIGACLIADDRAIVYRRRADSWDGVADTNNPAEVRPRLREFDLIWNANEVDHGLRSSRRS